MTLLIERRELLDRFRRGERRALEEVYRHYVSEVARFLTLGFTFSSRDRTLRFSGYRQPFDLDNALQETFTRAFKESARHGYDGLHPYRNYLYAIARNHVIDEFRSRESAMTPFVEECADEGDGESASSAAAREAAEGEGASAEQDLLLAELTGLYRVFVERLEERDRSFFRARFEEQKSQVDAGAQCGLSHMQSRTLEKRLREQFLSFMHKRGYLETYGASARMVNAR
jgi:RNA polymerase sigma factor (sigma-70 family)